MKRIYISDVVHEHLKQEAKQEGRTLQWLVEERLTNYKSQQPINIGAPDFGLEGELAKRGIQYGTSESYFAREADKNSNQSFEAFLAEYSQPNQKKPPHPKYGYPCCHEDKPCKHWQWDIDTGEGYVNSLTGQVKEVL